MNGLKTKPNQKKTKNQPDAACKRFISVLITYTQTENWRDGRRCSMQMETKRKVSW